jgi:nicotinate-nucleotide adenylyltransferase
MGGPTYTADTLTALANRYPGAELVLLVGADVAARIDTWERPEEVRLRATIVVMSRPGSDRIRLPEGWKYEVLEAPAYDISSTEVRRRVAAGEVISDLVPAGVALVIEEVGLYREAG